jgi:hypothetical protein
MTRIPTAFPRCSQNRDRRERPFPFPFRETVVTEHRRQSRNGNTVEQSGMPSGNTVEAGRSLTAQSSRSEP